MGSRKRSYDEKDEEKTVENITQGVKRLRTSTPDFSDSECVALAGQPSAAEPTPGARSTPEDPARGTQQGQSSFGSLLAETPAPSTLPGGEASPSSSGQALSPAPGELLPAKRKLRPASPLDIHFPRQALSGVSVFQPGAAQAPQLVSVEEGVEVQEGEAQSEGGEIAEPSTPGHSDVASPFNENQSTKRKHSGKYARRESGDDAFNSLYDEANYLLRSLHFERMKASDDPIYSPPKRRK